MSAEEVLLQEALVDWSVVSLVEANDHKGQLEVIEVADADFYRVPQLVGQEEEGGGLFKALLPQQDECVLLSLALPVIFGEVVAEEGRLLGV